MSNLIPPLLSSTPPPITGTLDEDDDEFGDFRAAADSFDCDDFSLPPSPQKFDDVEVQNHLPNITLDINSNTSQKITNAEETTYEKSNKDYQDHRKSLDDISSVSENGVNCGISEAVSLTIDDNQSCKFVSEPDQNLYKADGEVDSDGSINQCSESDVDDGLSVSLSNYDNVENVVVEATEGSKPSESALDSYNSGEESKESSHKNTNSDEISELQESPDFTFDNINPKISDTMDERVDSSSHEIDGYNLSQSSLSFKVGEEFGLSDDDFGDFENHFAQKEEVENTLNEEGNNSAITLEQQQECQEDGDDFGNFESPCFGDFSHFDVKVNDALHLVQLDVRTAASKSENILTQVFPKINQMPVEFELFDDTAGNIIFEELKDVTETKALIYQWSKSNSQKMFLKSLNIDMRNILYGPAWNGSLPRFAANLGMAPLEPTKSEILTPTPVQNDSSPSISSQKINSDIPTAQFDWSDSGLINPLDSASSGSTEQNQGDFSKSDLLPSSLDKLESVSSFFESEIFYSTNSEKSPIDGLGTSEKFKTDDVTTFESPKLVPLRETHISGECNDFKPGWLQPTILTPDLPRKEPLIEPEDDEFDDFQMVLPEELTAKPSTTSLSDLSEKTAPVVRNEEDEFTDFHSSLPQTQLDINNKPLQPVALEPLKPTIQYKEPAKAQINWPDPGVTDDDIRNIELSYSRQVPPKEEVVDITTKPNEQATRKAGQETAKEKTNSTEEDEWTDFVSVTNPIKQYLPERTATPDLPLSVLNLNNVQAPKQPIPVITPSGLVQTTLSSNLQPRHVIQTTMKPMRPQSSPMQPSIISNQFAANAFPKTDDDDDWSDFVSSQPMPQVNGFQQKFQKPATTNIIMNPSHFDSFNRSTQQVKQTRNLAAGFSAIPDLDFIAPRSRTSKK